MNSAADTQALPAELRKLVKDSVALLGRVIEQQAGPKLYAHIENLRRDMAELRDRDKADTPAVLQQSLAKLRKLSPADREIVARSFTLMLEIMNSCENAYRSHRLAARAAETMNAPAEGGPSAIIYVLTAHPTEARSPDNIAVFHLIQSLLIRALNGESEARIEKELFHALELAWRISIVRAHAPAVGDEAEHIYSTLFENGIMDALLKAAQDFGSIYVRSWVGGDKDGHPGVDDKVMRESLGLSRWHLVRYAEQKFAEVEGHLALLERPTLKRELTAARKQLALLVNLRDGDATRVTKFRTSLLKLEVAYRKHLGAVHPNVRALRQVLHMFPGFVVPLEIRESSDVLMESEAAKKRVAVDRMLTALAKISKGGDPRWYARGFIVSMTSSVDHLRAARAKSVRAFGSPKLPLIPLFEQRAALEHSTAFVREVLRDKVLGQDVRKTWGGFFEVMVGYSDSSKESGVLASRLAISEAMVNIDRACTEAGVRPLFFQGSGGSVDRGGGSIQDQTAWWPRAALDFYKVTIQGEMVERSFASPEITRGQLQRIHESAARSLGATRAPHDVHASLRAFAARTARMYADTIADEGFLRVVESATPYPQLTQLRIGSRPTKRKSPQQKLAVSSLRAIPWVLCWTQTRLLLPTWWGIGSAWRQASAQERGDLRAALKTEPVFTSFIKALGFTLSKVELETWRVYLEESGLKPNEAEAFFTKTRDEYHAARDFVTALTGEKDLLWFRPWLATSIRLRSPMIHPLNLLQIIAREDGDAQLLRQTVTGIASGMLTTG